MMLSIGGFGILATSCHGRQRFPLAFEHAFLHPASQPNAVFEANISACHSFVTMAD
jgi:hypothetical protein